MAALSSSAPELEGMWTEVRRKQRAKALKGSATAEVGCHVRELMSTSDMLVSTGSPSASLAQ